MTVTAEGPAAGAESPPGPTLTILVATLGERRNLFARLLDVLLPQLDPYTGAVKILAYWSNGEPGLPEIRQRMVEAACSDYIVCVDDDDLVPDYYVAETMAALSTWPDYVGWRVQCYTNGRPTAVADHSLKHGGWSGHGRVLLRDISHVNPIRTALARRVTFCVAQPGEPEDRAWVAQLRGLGLLHTEVYVDRIMYHYHYVPTRTTGGGSRWRAPGRIRRQGFERLPVDHPHFSYHPGSACSGS